MTQLKLEVQNGNIVQKDTKTGKVVYEYDPLNDKFVQVAPIDADVIPSQDDNTKLGSSSKRWSEIHGKKTVTEQINTKSRGPTVIVQVKDNGKIVADGPDNEVDIGDFSTQSDVTSVIQSAVDAGSEVRIKSHSSKYQLAVAGQDSEGVDYCLSQNGDTHLVIEKGATLRYPAQNTGSGGSSPDVATPILCSGIDNWKITVDGVIEGGASGSSQDSEKISAMCIKIGVRSQTGTGCKHWEVRGFGQVNGAYRHGIEAIQPRTENGRISVREMNDPAGDDAVSISGEARNVIAHDVTARNRKRNGGWGNGAFEVEDGATECGFVRCYTVDQTVGDGFVVGKQHSGWSATQDCFARNCYVIDSSVGSAFIVGQTLGGKNPKNMELDGCWAVGVDGSYVGFRPSNSPIESPIVKNGGGIDVDGSAVFVSQSNSDEIRDAEIVGNTFRNCGKTDTTPLGVIRSQFKDLKLGNRAINCHEGWNVHADNVTYGGSYLRGFTNFGFLLNDGEGHEFIGVTSKNHGGRALKVDGATNWSATGSKFYDDQSTKTMPVAITLNSGTGSFVNCEIGPSSNGVYENYTTDVSFTDCEINDDPAGYNTATRPREDGIIRGGHLGGGDPSSITGGSDGDRLLSDGSGVFLPDRIYQWDAGASEWVGPRAASSSIDFGSISDGAQAENTISVTGADTGDYVAPQWPSSLPDGLAGNMYVSSGGTVTVRLLNIADGGGAIDPGSLTYGATVIPA